LPNEYLNFKEISEKVSFIDLFNYLNISYSQKGEELKTNDGIVVNIKKNLYFNTKDKEQKGSVINFLASFKGIDLRSAAKELKDLFLNDEPESKKQIPELELHYTDYLNQYSISPELAKEYEVGLVKQRSIMSGKIAFRIRDINCNPIGYVGYNIKDNSWFFPKGFKRPLYNIHRVKDSNEIIIVVNPFDALKIIGYGYLSVVALLGKTMNEEQVEQLSQVNNIEKIIVVHPEAENILLRLSKRRYVKIFPFSDLSVLSKEEILANINSPRE
jgi:DNA primase